MYKTDKNVSVEEVQQIVLKEISRPGPLLGFRAWHAKIRQYHELNVARALAYTAIEDFGPNGFKYRRVRKKAEEKKEVLYLKGPIECFPLVIKISSWTSRTVPSRLQYTSL